MFNKNLKKDGNNDIFQSEIYHFQPKPNMKLAIFENWWPKIIDGKEYKFEEFVNSDEYIIHDVRVIRELPNGKIFRYVWYEKNVKEK